MSLSKKILGAFDPAGGQLGSATWTGGPVLTSDPYSTASQLNALSSAVAAQNAKQNISMLQGKDIVIRKVRNGWRVIVVSERDHTGQCAPLDEYIAKDFDDLQEVLKLATVNQRVDGAK